MPILINAGPSQRGAHFYESVLRCPRIHALHLKMNETGTFGANQRMPLVRGSLGHVGLAHYYQRQIETAAGRDPDVYYEPFAAMEVLAEQEGGIYPELLPVAQRAVRSYVEQFQTENLHPAFVEQPAWVKIRDRYLYTARFDLVTLDRNGYYWIYDHKFVSRIDGKTVVRYQLALQFIGLAYLGQRIFGAKLGGVRVNLVECGDPTRVKRDSPGAAPAMLSRFEDTIVHANQLLERYAALPVEEWPVTPSEMTCMTPYGLCDFADWCAWGIPEHLQGPVQS